MCVNSRSCSGDDAARRGVCGAPVHTYSIVARDSTTGELGVAVQSHWFSVGSPWCGPKPGVGAVATQSFTEVSYGPLGLDLMRAGKTAPQALAALVAADPQDVGPAGGDGGREGHASPCTPGSKCIAMAGHHPGAQFCTAGESHGARTRCGMRWRARTRPRTGDLAERLLAALDAAQTEGGDIRGKQSAAILDRPGHVDRAGRGRTASWICASRTAPRRSRNCAASWRCTARTTAWTKATARWR